MPVKGPEGGIRRQLRAAMLFIIVYGESWALGAKSQFRWLAVAAIQRTSPGSLGNYCGLEVAVISSKCRHPQPWVDLAMSPDMANPTRPRPITRPRLFY